MTVYGWRLDRLLFEALCIALRLLGVLLLAAALLLVAVDLCR